MSVQVCFCGEVVADLLEQNQGSGDFKLLLGGSQFHGATGAAKAVRREGFDFKISFIGPISTDTFGSRFFAKLEEASIDTGGVKRVDRNTTLAIVSVQPGKENAFSFYGRDTAEQMTKIEDLPETVGTPEDKKIFCFGSISTILEPARFAWLEFAARQKPQSLLIYDLNTRPSIAKDPERYRGLVAEWARTAHVIKASDADIGWAYPGTSIEDVAALWLKEGTSMAVFTKGRNGSEAYTRTTKASAESMDLIATNTIGAGDNFNAGLALYMAKENCLTPGDVTQIPEARLARILSGANNTAACHLISIGAQTRSPK